MNKTSDVQKKIKQSREGRVPARRGRLLFYVKVATEPLSDEVTFEQKPKGSGECRRLFQEE